VSDPHPKPDGFGKITQVFFHSKGLVCQTAGLHPFLIQNNPSVLRKMVRKSQRPGSLRPPRTGLHRLHYFLECAYVSSSLDLTYSPAVTTGYFGGNSSEQHDGIA